MQRQAGCEPVQNRVGWTGRPVRTHGPAQRAQRGRCARDPIYTRNHRPTLHGVTRINPGGCASDQSGWREDCVDSGRWTAPPSFTPPPCSRRQSATWFAISMDGGTTNSRFAQQAFAASAPEPVCFDWGQRSVYACRSHDRGVAADRHRPIPERPHHWNNRCIVPLFERHSDPPAAKPPPELARLVGWLQLCLAHC